MKIGIDARLWGIKHGGIGHYVKQLVLELQKRPSNFQYVLFCRHADSKDIPLAKDWKKVVADIPHYSLKEQLQLHKIFQQEKVDLLHIPHFNVPFLYKDKFLVTIHDLFWNQFRGFNATTLPAPVYLVKYFGFKIVLRHAILGSDKIIVPSRTVGREVAKQFPAAKSKIKAIYEGVTKKKVSRSFTQALLKKYKIHKPYLLYVGNLYPHKNVETLIFALKKQRLENILLVVICSRDIFWRRFENFVQSHNLESSVRFLGYVSDEELAGFYSQTQAFVFPSLSEGFGLPGLEAMAYGVPVLCSNLPVFKEIYKDAALYFNPKDPLDIAAKIQKVLSDNQIRSWLVAQGKRRVKNFSWQKMAEQTLKIYEEVLSQ